MANRRTIEKQGARQGPRAARAIRRRRGRARPRAAGRRRARRTIDTAQRRLRGAGTNVRAAGGNLYAASEAGAGVARQLAAQTGERLGAVASGASERVGEVAGTVRDRLSEAAETVRDQVEDATEAVREQVSETAEHARGSVGRLLRGVPRVLRAGARYGRAAAEGAGARVAVRVLDASTRVLSTAAGYVNELAPRRRADRTVVEDLVLEQRGWARNASRAFDRVTQEVRDDSMRTLFVRAKLQAIRHEELLVQLLEQLGSRRREDEDRLPVVDVELPAAREAGTDGGREALARALAAATLACDGWRALTEVGAVAESVKLSEALIAASRWVGKEPEEHRDLARDALLVCTAARVFGDRADDESAASRPARQALRAAGA
jgi:hypothetical protein